jgi:hypothetical protein
MPCPCLVRLGGRPERQRERLAKHISTAATAHERVVRRGNGNAFVMAVGAGVARKDRMVVVHGVRLERFSAGTSIMQERR